MKVSGVGPWLWAAGIIVATAIALLALTRPWDSTDSPESAVSPDVSTNSGIVATLPEPTATDANGLPVPPTDPFMPPSPPVAPTGAVAPTEAAGPTSAPTPPTMPPLPPTPPATPSPPPTPPPSPPVVPDGRAIACQTWLQPGPTAQTVRVVVRTDAPVSRLWATLRSATGTQTGVVSVSSGYGEQVVPGLTVTGTSVIIHADPALTSRSESCRFG